MLFSVVHGRREGDSPSIAQMRPMATQISTDRGRYRCVSVSAEDGISVISGSRMAWRRFTTKQTERAYARHQTHRRFSESTGSDFSVFRVPRSGFSVFSGQKRLARWAGFTTEHTERAYARHRTHRKYWEWRHGFLCIQCAAGGGFSVFSGRKRSSVK